MHSLQFQEEQEKQILFSCSKCGEQIAFIRPGLGEPVAQLIDAAWRTPENPDKWMTPCNELP
jgi:hypothetical protein